MMTMGSDMEQALTALYGEDQVAAVITLKVDTKEADRIATEIAKFDVVYDVYLVTGDTDIVAKARFKNYKGLKDFVLSSLAPISGIKDTKTLMVVTTYKEGGQSRAQSRGQRDTPGDGQMDTEARLKQVMDGVDETAEDTTVTRNRRRGAGHR